MSDDRIALDTQAGLLVDLRLNVARVEGALKAGNARLERERQDRRRQDRRRQEHEHRRELEALRRRLEQAETERNHVVAAALRWMDAQEAGDLVSAYDELKTVIACYAAAARRWQVHTSGGPVNVEGAMLDPYGTTVSLWRSHRVASADEQIAPAPASAVVWLDGPIHPDVIPPGCIVAVDQQGRRCVIRIAEESERPVSSTEGAQ